MLLDQKSFEKISVDENFVIRITNFSIFIIKQNFIQDFFKFKFYFDR